MEEKRKKPEGSGRKKGTPNRTTKQIRNSVAELLDEYVHSGMMFRDFMKLGEKDRFALAEKLLNYCIPRLQAVQAEVTDTSAIPIAEQLRKLAELED